jgi:hypothetical protein
MRPSTNSLRVLALSAALATLLAACSEYLDRREAVSLNAGDALASNQVTQVVDPWPRDSANRNIAFNGERMQSAIARYRTNRVYAPVGIGTSGAYGQSSGSQGGAAANNTTPLGPTVNQQAVK